MCQLDCKDDTSIDAGDLLYRRIHLTQLVKDDDTGLTRVSSGAFRDKDLSVNIHSALIGDGKSPDHCLRNHLVHKLVSVTASAARDHNQTVCRDPLPDDVSHGLIYGAKNRRAIEGLRDAARWIIPDEAPVYEDIQEEKRVHGISL